MTDGNKSREIAEIQEDRPPPPDREMVLLDAPSKDRLDKFSLVDAKAPGPIWVRFCFALGMLILLGIFTVAGVWGWLHNKTGEQMRDLVVLLSPITTLAAAVFAFYFTDPRKQ